MSYIGWVQAGGAWALRVLSFQNLSKSLPAAHVSAVTWGLSVCRNLGTLRLRFLAFHAGFLLVLRSNQKLGFV